MTITKKRVLELKREVWRYILDPPERDDLLSILDNYDALKAEARRLKEELRDTKADLGRARPLLSAATEMTEPGILSLHRILSFCNIHDGCSYCKETEKRLKVLLAALANHAAKEK